MYAETDAKILRELSCDIVMTVLRDVQRIRLEGFKKMLSEARAERPSGGKRTSTTHCRAPFIT